MTPSAKQQHYVPKVYLKHFATDETVDSNDPRVWIWDKFTANSRRGTTSINAVCRYRFLYSPAHLDGSRDWSLETEFSKMETQAGTLLPRLFRSDLDLTDESVREFLARFMASMHLRNVGIFNLTHRAVEITRKLYGAPTVTRASFGTIDLDDPENHAKAAFVQWIRSGVSRIAETMMAKQWVVVKSPDRTLETCDRPVVFFANGSLARGPLGTKASAMFPLAADRLLYMRSTMNRQDDRHWDAPTEFIASSNALIRANALRFVIGSKRLDFSKHDIRS